MPDFNDNRGSGQVGSRLARSGLVTASILALVFVVLGVVWGAHKRGRIHQLTDAKAAPPSPPPVRPGGQDIVRLSRLDRSNVLAPEFTSVTVLPGVGSEITQAIINPEATPGVPILDGSQEMDLEKPIADLRGAAFSIKVGPPAGSRDVLPQELVAGKPSKEAVHDILPDGDSLKTKFNDAPVPTAAGQLPPTVEASIATSISSRGLDVRITVKNLGTSPRNISISWMPRFLLPQAGAQGVRLIPPPVQNEDGSARHGAPVSLGDGDFDRTFRNLQYSYLSAGPETILQNIGSGGYSLKITTLTPTVSTVHVTSPKGSGSVLVSLSNVADTGDEGPVVAPGETVLWRVRVEAILNSSIPHTVSE